jgi:hypothetical protein
VLTLVVAVFAFVALEVVIFWVYPYLRDHWKKWWRCRKDAAAADSSGQAEPDDDGTKQNQQETEIQESKTQGEMQEAGEKNMREYLMLLGVLAASVTYQTGLKPPGGLWQDNRDSHSAGSSILHYINKRRYHAFFYSNSTSFMASVVVIILLLPETLHKYRLPLWPMHTAILLDMLGLLGAIQESHLLGHPCSGLHCSLCSSLNLPQEKMVPVQRQPNKLINHLWRTDEDQK